MYREMDRYKNLSASDKNFFDVLFKTLYFNKGIKYKNKTFQQAFGEAESTIHHRLDRVVASGLLSRYSSKKKDKYGRWFTENRTISLNALVFPGVHEDGE